MNEMLVDLHIFSPKNQNNLPIQLQNSSGQLGTITQQKRHFEQNGHIVSEITEEQMHHRSLKVNVYLPRVYRKDLWFTETVFKNPIMSSGMRECVHDSVCVCIKLSRPMYRASWQPGWNPLVKLSSLALTHRLTFVSACCYLAQDWPHGQREMDRDGYPHLSHTGAQTHTHTHACALQQTSFCFSVQTDLRRARSLKRWTKLDDGVR